MTGPSSLDGERIATSYPRLLQRFLDGNGIKATIVRMSGAVELAPRLQIARFICDLVSTGATLEANGLRPVETVLESEAVLIRTPRPLSAEKAELAERMLSRIDGVLATQESKYIMLNAPETALETDRRPAARRRGADHPAARRPAGPCRGPRGLQGIGVLGDAAAAQGRRRLGDPGRPDRKDDDVRKLAWSGLGEAERRAALARPAAAHRSGRAGRGPRDRRRRPRRRLGRRRPPCAAPRRRGAEARGRRADRRGGTALAQHRAAAGDRPRPAQHHRLPQGQPAGRA